jgi:hypothetical protein
MQPSEKIRQDIRTSNGCGDDEAAKTPEEETAIALTVGYFREALFHDRQRTTFAGEVVIEIFNGSIVSINDCCGSL